MNLLYDIVLSLPLIGFLLLHASFPRRRQERLAL